MTNETLDGFARRVHELSRHVTEIERPDGGWDRHEKRYQTEVVDKLREASHEAINLRSDIANAITMLKSLLEWQKGIEICIETEIGLLGGVPPYGFSRESLGFDE